MKFFKKYQEIFYVLFRLFVGVMFFVHGIMKFTGDQMPPAFSMFWFAGIIEMTVGVLVTFGVFVSYAAMLGVAQMIAAYLIAHLPKGWAPLGPSGNGGELALMYMAAFLVMIPLDSGRYALDSLFRKNR